MINLIYHFANVCYEVFFSLPHLCFVMFNIQKINRINYLRQFQFCINKNRVLKP
jgi:hypothetical protein